MFTLFEGWFWCFFLEKKDILGDFEPRNGGMVNGGRDYRGGMGGNVGLRWLLLGRKRRVGRERGIGKRMGEEFNLTHSQDLTGRDRRVIFFEFCGFRERVGE